MRFCIAAALMMPVAAMAQGNPGPFGGLFGRSAATVGEERTTVEARASMGGQYDTALLAPENSPDLGTQGGFGGGANAGAGFQHQSPRLTTAVSGGVSRLQAFSTPSYGANIFSAGASLDSAVTTRFRVTTNAGYVHSPFFQLYQNFGGTSFGGASIGGTRADGETRSRKATRSW